MLDAYVLHAPCLRRLEMSTCRSCFSAPLRIEAPLLRDVLLRNLDRDTLHVCEPEDARGLTNVSAAALVIVSRSLRSICVDGSSHLKALRVRSSSLFKFVIYRTRLTTLSIDAPHLQHLNIWNAAASLRSFDMRNFVLSSFTISHTRIFSGATGACAGPPYPSCPLRSLDLCCPGLRFFFLSGCPELCTLSIEHREPPAPECGDSKATMATSLQEVSVLGCEGLTFLVLKGGSTGALRRTRATSFLRRPPHRAPLIELEVDGFPALQHVEVGTGWGLESLAKQVMVIARMEQDLRRKKEELAKARRQRKLLVE